MNFEQKSTEGGYENIKNISKNNTGYSVTLGDKTIPFTKKPGQLVQEAAKEALASHVPEYEKQKKDQVKIEKQEKAKELLSLINEGLKIKGIDNQINLTPNDSTYSYKFEKPIMGVSFTGKLNLKTIQGSIPYNKDGLNIMTYLDKKDMDEDGFVSIDKFISKIEDLYNGDITMDDGNKRHISIAEGKIYWDSIKDSDTILKEKEEKRLEIKKQQEIAEEYYNKIKNIEFSITENGQIFIKAGGTFGDIKKSLFLKLYQNGKPLKANNNDHFIKGGANYIEMKELFEWAINNSYIK